MNPTPPATHHCGRHAPHPAHAWQTPAHHRRIRPIYYCAGLTRTTGGDA